MKFFDPRGDIEKTAHKLPHWQQGEVAIFVTFRLADSLPRELLDDWLRARDAFLAANPPPWDDLTEACYHGPFFDKLDEYLDQITDATQHVPTAPCESHASRKSWPSVFITSTAIVTNSGATSSCPITSTCSSLCAMANR